VKITVNEDEEKQALFLRRNNGQSTRILFKKRKLFESSIWRRKGSFLNSKIDLIIA